MGTTYFSVSFRTSNLDAVTGSLKSGAKKARAAAYVGKPTQGWITVFPNAQIMSDEMLEQVTKESGSSYAIVLNLYDGDVLSYWLYKQGELVDHYNSCPDYFGTEEATELEAVGNPEAFGELLDAKQRDQLNQLLKPRMINGEEIGGALPDMEEDRFASLMGLLGIIGGNSSYDYLKDGEDAPGLGTADDLIHVKKSTKRT